MSYSRFSKDCDVYTFWNVSGDFECCGCVLRDPTAFADGERLRFGVCGPEWFPNRTELVEHLREHQRAGHKVPEEVIKGILEDDVCRICGDDPCTPSCEDDNVPDHEVETWTTRK